MWQNFNTKQGTQQQKTVGMETLDTHFLLTVYILYKRTKFPSNIVFTSQSRIFLCREYLFRCIVVVYQS